jgi:hypothetical protein
LQIKGLFLFPLSRGTRPSGYTAVGVNDSFHQSSHPVGLASLVESGWLNCQH